MAKIIWYNQPTNHSATTNFLFLTPENEVGTLSIYMSNSTGPYILGGPALTDYDGNLTKAAKTLISCLPADFHFFSDNTDFLGAVDEAWRKAAQEGGDVSSERLEDYLSYEGIRVYSKNYDTRQCCEMLRNNSTPETPITFVNWYRGGSLPLGTELAHVYYNMSTEKREELNLRMDWHHSVEA